MIAPERGAPGEVTLAGRAQRLIRERRARDETFAALAGALSETAFDIMLLLYVHAMQGRPISISAASTAGGGPATTGLRWLGVLDARGLIRRVADTRDHRRVHVALSDEGLTLMTRYLEKL